MKNKKGNIVIIAFIIVIVAITAGVIGYLLATKTQAPVAAPVANQKVAKPVVTAQPATLPAQPKENTISNNTTNNNGNNVDACAGIKQITDYRDAKNPIYKTVSIGNQCWLNRNLNVGGEINGIKKQSDNSLLEKYCYSDSESNCDTDGGLYLWDEAMQYTKKDGTQGICPDGWHIPSDKDWVALEKYLWSGVKEEDCRALAMGCICSESRSGFGCEPIGDMMRPISSCIESNLKHCGTSGFDAVYSGDRNNYAEDIFTYRGDTALFWSSTQISSAAAIERHVYNTWNGGVNRGIYEKSNAFSIRCIKN